MFNISKHSIVKRRRQKILRYVHYNKHKDSKNFYREQCLLFLPFSDTENEHLLENDTWHLVYNKNQSIIELNAKKYTKETFHFTSHNGTTSSQETITSSNSEMTKYDIDTELPNSTLKKNLS